MNVLLYIPSGLLCVGERSIVCKTKMKKYNSKEIPCTQKDINLKNKNFTVFLRWFHAAAFSILFSLIEIKFLWLWWHWRGTENIRKAMRSMCECVRQAIHPEKGWTKENNYPENQTSDWSIWLSCLVLAESIWYSIFSQMINILFLV